MGERRILVVDDAPDVLLLMEAFLIGHGFKVITAKDGDEGLRIANSGKPDIVVLDVVLPKKTGHEVCRALKSGASTRSIPVIMTSVKSGPADAAEAKAAGADAFISKTEDPEVLLAEIEKLTKR